jgi:hypothetical protein
MHMFARESCLMAVIICASMVTSTKTAVFCIETSPHTLDVHMGCHGASGPVAWGHHGCVSLRCRAGRGGGAIGGRAGAAGAGQLGCHPTRPQL